LGGAILIAVGLMLLAAQTMPEAGRWFVLGLGLVFLAAFLTTRHYGFLVPGGILTGLGAGIAATTWVTEGEASGALVVGGLALGFVLIWLVAEFMALAERHPWPLVPGVILGIVAVGIAANQPDVERWMGLGVGAVMVLLGGVLILRRARGPA
jgi:hypothetical protein